MQFPLAYADAHDTSLSTMRVLLFTCLWLAGIAVLAAIPIFQAWRRAHRQAGIILVIGLFWGLVAGGSAYLTLSARDQWSREETLLLESGYYEPQSHRHDPPAWPWGLWITLAGVYGGTLVWSLAGKAPPPPPSGNPQLPENYHNN